MQLPERQRIEKHRPVKNDAVARSLTTNIRRVENTLIESQSKWEKLLPAHVDPERCLRLVVGSLRKNPKLLDCNPATLYSAIITACQLGLEPDGTMGEAYLIPYGQDATLVIGYKGLLKLARQSGDVAAVQAAVVREGDGFDYAMGDDEFIKHKPASGADRSESPITHAYAIITLANGHKARAVWDIAKLEAHRDQYVRASGPGSPWQTATEQMYVKTVLRSLLTGGMVPISTELAEGLAADGSVETPTRQLFENYLANSEPPVAALPEPADEPADEPDAEPVEPAAEPVTYQGEPGDLF